jgi:hypothetical protein
MIISEFQGYATRIYNECVFSRDEGRAIVESRVDRNFTSESLRYYYRETVSAGDLYFVETVRCCVSVLKYRHNSHPWQLIGQRQRTAHLNFISELQTLLDIYDNQ